MLTDRLELRPPIENDRDYFVELFMDEEFMIFTAGVLDREGANRRFDHMLSLGREISCAKHVLIERPTGQIVGYAGADHLNIDGKEFLEFAYRLVPGARGFGYATEAGRALLPLAAGSLHGEILVSIDPANLPSWRVAHKLGFAFWKQSIVRGHVENLYRLQLDRYSEGRR